MIQDRSDTARSDSTRKDSEHVERDRVKALAQLGLAIGIAYSAPLILRLDRAEAHLVPPSDPHCIQTSAAHCIGG